MTAYPFDEEKEQFFYTDKMVALRASGSMEVGEKEYSFPLGGGDHPPISYLTKLA